MKQPANQLDKILDDKLREFARADLDEERSVIIELDLATPTVQLRPTDRRGAAMHAPSGIMKESDEQERANRRKVEEMQAFLDRLLPQPANWLWSAQTMIATARPAQLREIASFHLTKCIRPNRTHTTL